ncbi:plasmid mobilization relaxosome protein MobC [Echinicola marina]|uniref:plasmid mobilization protein n=1 Tax=Echinicola marina TaxID=2859768 RepID=UPI001CF7101C|nr:plasmid mobilization relaxosome protein MobC [Echinicola marina]UCS92248.1 plasmid mobilization relaxosome protein MobC [Echinicola marina]
MGKRNKSRLKQVESRIPEQRYHELVNLLSKSQNATMSALIRDILSNKTIICKNHDETADLLLDQMHSIQMEIHAIGVNINQITRHFNSLNDPLWKKSLVKQLEKQLALVGNKMEELERGLQKSFS